MPQSEVTFLYIRKASRRSTQNFHSGVYDDGHHDLPLPPKNLTDSIRDTRKRQTRIRERKGFKWVLRRRKDRWGYGQ